MVIDRDMDPHGPAGPTSFWKVADFGDVDLEKEGVVDEYLSRLQDEVLDGMGMDHNSEMDEDWINGEDEEDDDDEDEDEDEDENDEEEDEEDDDEAEQEEQWYNMETGGSVETHHDQIPAEHE